MAINLQKGGRINLTKEAPGLKKIRVGLGWKPQKFDNSADFDLDATAFVCRTIDEDTGGAVTESTVNEKSVLIADEFMVFYNQLSDPTGSVTHSGDNRVGGSAICETITIDLEQLAAKRADVSEVSFIVTIDEAESRKQRFGQVNNSFIVLHDDATGKELARYDLEDNFSNETAVQFGSLLRKKDSWTFSAVGAGFNKGLADFVVVYGGKLAE